MNYKIRQSLLIISLGLFIILTPLLLLYTWGFHWNWQEKKIVQTGAIILQSTPSKVDIYLNGQLQKKQILPAIEGIKSFVGFNGLAPGDYEVLLTQNGYHPWKKRLKIEPGLVTKVENILLLPKESIFNRITSHSVENFIFSPDEKKVAYTVSDGKTSGIWVINLESKNETQIVVSDSATLPHTKNYYKLQWSWDSQKLLFASIVEDKKRWFVIDTKKPSELINVTNLISSEANDLKWHPHNNGKIFYLKEGNLWQANYLDKTTSDLNINDVLGWTIEKNALYWTQAPTGILYRSNLDGKNKQQITLNPLPDVSPGKNQKIIVSEKEKIAILNSDGKLYLIDEKDQPIFIKEEVLNAQFSEDSKKLLYQTENEIWTYWLEEKEMPPKRERGTKELIIRHSQKIAQISWYLDFEHIFFVVGSKIKCVELDSRDQRNTMDFIETNKENQKIFLSPKNKKLYFTDEKDRIKSLYEVELPR